MMGSRSDIQKKFKNLLRKQKVAYTVSFTDMHLLAKLTNSSEKCSGFHFKFGNYIKSGSFNTCLFKELCKDMF